MSEPENFLERWSRRKHEAAQTETAAEREKGKQEPREQNEEASKPESKHEEPEFDISKLPPIESIDANSDVRAFMQRGVPPELKHAALRRAWSADPEIRDFIGLVENGWDFNDPSGAPGFGPLQKEDLPRLLAQAVGPPPDSDTFADVKSVKTADVDTQNATPVSDSFASGSTKDVAPGTGGHPDRALNDVSPEPASGIATQNNSTRASPEVTTRPRRHGGALPT